MIKATDDEIEADRHMALAEFDHDETGFDPSPGSYGCHEALHTASLVNHLVCDALLTHPAIVANADWYRRAQRAHEALYELYQAIGNDHLGKIP